MFDTGKAARFLNYQSFGLGFLLKHFCDVDADKSYQRADWRLRPLTSEMLHYARLDTHYLLYIYDRLKYEIQKKAQSMKQNGKQCIHKVLMMSRDVCLRRYVKSDKTREGVRRAGVLRGEGEQGVLEELLQWRDEVARQEDEAPNFVMKVQKLMQVARKPPKDRRTLLRVLGHTEYALKYAEDIMKCIQHAKKKVKERVQIVEKVPAPELGGLVKVELPRVNIRVIEFTGSSVFEKVKQEKSKECEQVIQNFIESFGIAWEVGKLEEGELVDSSGPARKSPNLSEAEDIIPITIEQKYKLQPKKSPKTPKQLPTKRNRGQRSRLEIGALDNDIKLMPVKRRNLFSKKKR